MNFYAEFVVHLQTTSVGYVVSTSATSILIVEVFAYFVVRHCADFVVDTMQSQAVQYVVESFVTSVVSK